MWVGPSVAAVVESLIPPQGEGHSRAGGDAGGRDGVVVVGGRSGPANAISDEDHRLHGEEGARWEGAATAGDEVQ